MSFKVAIACEDHTWDQYIVRPIVTALLNNLGKPKARIEVINDPRSTGINVLLAQVEAILAKWGSVVDVVLFAVDLDCLDGRDGRGDRLQALSERVAAASAFAAKAVLVAAIQELEVWALWGCRADLPPWAEVRSSCDPKETFFEPLITQADRKSPDGGRARMVSASLANGVPSLLQGCTELAELRDALSVFL
jgi:hypothetical protein